MSSVTNEKIGKRILGAWKLVSWVFINESGEEVKFFGQQPKGILIYHDSGYMSVQIAREERQDFASQGIDAGTKEEMAEAFKTYLSYYGRYEEAEPGVFVHSVEGTLFPNWLKHKETRIAELQEDVLMLSTPPTPTSTGNVVFKITWKKIMN
ncbi:MAG: lipocalin-like domain-containing protein [Cytophagales bacterium]|nr:lipocalin-like domain-containing protein [Cytophagales bacterium]